MTNTHEIADHTEDERLRGYLEEERQRERELERAREVGVRGLLGEQLANSPEVFTD